jgi:hypothetical protein
MIVLIMATIAEVLVRKKNVQMKETVGVRVKSTVILFLLLIIIIVVNVQI